MSQGEWQPLEADRHHETDQTWLNRVERSPENLDFSPVRPV